MKNVKKPFHYIALLMVMILSGSISAWADTVKGNVVDESGEPLIGVTVMVSGTSVGTATDIDGNYTINVPNIKKDQLVFSYVGMAEVKEHVNGRKVINVTMKEDSDLLDEVVVVGYGQQKKASVVGAITQTTGEVLERAAGVHDISAALTGNLPGVVTVQSSGMPGDESAKITIRGASSWNNSDPLVLVDGIERDMNSVDVSSVKSISVLKDASATAVYGVKGANGVILITTKRGQEGRAKIDVGFTATMKTVSKLPDKCDSYDALLWTNKAVMHELPLLESSWAYMTPLAIANKYRYPADLAESERYPNVDWQDTLFKDHAMSYNANVSVSGGTKFVRYFAVVDFVSEGDLFKDIDNGRSYPTGFGYNRINVRSNLDFSLTPTTTFKMNLAGSTSQRTSTTPNGGNTFDQGNWNNAQIWSGVYNIAPDAFMPIYSDGSFGYYPYFKAQVVNSVATLVLGGLYHSNTTSITTDFVLDQDLKFITPGLGLHAMISWDNRFLDTGHGINDLYHNAQNKWIDPTTGVEQTTEPIDNLTYFDYNAGNEWTTQGGSVQDYSTTRNMNYQVQLNYNREFGKNNVGATAVWTRQENAWGNMIPIHREDWVFRATYNFDDRYFFEYNGAYNGSEKFGKGFRFGFFNSGAIGWRPSQEKFWTAAGLDKWWQELKIRASYGEIGDDTGERFMYMDQWAYGGSTKIDPTAANSIYQWYRQSVIGNPDAHWEKVKKMNLGIDFSFLNSLISGTVEIFKDKRDDILISGSDRAMPSYFGATPPTVNLGKAQSTGYEFELRLNKMFGPVRVWANLNMTHAVNKIKLRDDPELKPDYQKQAGYAIGQTHSHINGGFLNSLDELYGSPAHDVNDNNRLPGDYYIVDFNGDGKVDVEDSAPYGFTGTPQNTYNATLGCEWKGLSFFVQFYGVNNVTRDVGLRSFTHNTHNVYLIGDWWNGTDLDGDVLLPRWYSQLSSYSDGTQFLYDASYCRLKNMEIAYTWTGGWIKKLGMNSLKVYLNGNNLFLWSKMPDDRESNFSGGGGQGAYPTMRRFNLGLKFNF
ncbi:MAG: TonB-dependent receptor [Muribaculaceae bacterium]|nr:TonB-dependent receptor [Muribaculaceae bacterium]